MQQIRMKHHGSSKMEAPRELLFSTPFDYFFPEAAADEDARIRYNPAETIQVLLELADEMGDPGHPGDPPSANLDGVIPAAMTYLGQFIDHDLTARTDRDEGRFRIGDGAEVTPVDPDVVVRELRNGRRPALDLDSVYGDGPGLAPNSTTEASILLGRGLFRKNLRMRLSRSDRRVDVPRLPVDNEPGPPGSALIADARNDENIMISQLHAAFLALHNRIMAGLSPSAFPTDALRYVRARQLMSWTFQYLVGGEYLDEVCDPGVVADVKANGPRHLGPMSGRGVFMPLEFSAAAFRFGHTMIRPGYQLNGENTEVFNIMNLFFPNEGGRVIAWGQGGRERILDFPFRIDWDFFIREGDRTQLARRFDPRIAQGLFNLTFGNGDPVLRHLARRNLLRGLQLSLPSGQAAARCLGVQPLKPEDIRSKKDSRLDTILRKNQLDERTPLWFYILREADIQQDGKRLGEVGSRLVAETLWNMILSDPTSFIHHRHDPAVQSDGIALPLQGGSVVRTLGDFLRAANVFA